jgi:AhpD family alkylhydroperoxidase
VIHILDYTKRAPWESKAVAGGHDHVLESRLEDSLLKLIYLRVSQINRSAACIEAQTRDLLKAGMAVEKLALIVVWRQAAPLFTEREQAALLWTESVTSGPETAICDSDYRAVNAHFTSNEVVELTVAVSLMSTYNRLGVMFPRH